MSDKPMSAPPLSEDAWIAEAMARCEKAAPAPWRSMRQGNQYINADYIPTAMLVGASYVEGLKRPWNPHSFFSYSCNAKEFETARFLDADADFIAHARTDLPRALRELTEARARIAALTRERDRERDARDKAMRALREKDEAMGVLCEIGGSDLIERAQVEPSPVTAPSPKRERPMPDEPVTLSEEEIEAILATFRIAI